MFFMVRETCLRSIQRIKNLLKPTLPSPIVKQHFLTLVTGLATDNIHADCFQKQFPEMLIE